MKKVIVVLMIVMLGLSLVACDPNSGMLNQDQNKVAMVADKGTINDNAFNQSAWEGLQELEKETGTKVSYINSTQSSDYKSNLEQLTDEGNILVWGVGYSLADSIIDVAKANPTCSYAIADYTYDGNQPNNVTGVGFRSEEPAFLVGYIAGMTTKTNKVGFIGGERHPVISQFEYGYKAGVKYAAKELGKNIEVVEQYVGAYNDASGGKGIASKMYSTQNCDIIFHSAGHSGNGVIEQAKQSNKLVIGVDQDQSSLAPNNVLTSALKKVGNAVKKVSEKKLSGENIGGENYIWGLKEECVGIPKENKNVDPQVYESTMKIQDKIIAGDLVVPKNESQYEKFLQDLGL